jgi:hypothetical protein
VARPQASESVTPKKMARFLVVFIQPRPVKSLTKKPAFRKERRLQNIQKSVAFCKCLW